MALNDLSGHDVRQLKRSADSAVMACKNRLLCIIAQVDGITQTQLEKLGFDASEITELTEVKNKITAVKDEIINQGW